MYSKKPRSKSLIFKIIVANVPKTGLGKSRPNEHFGAHYEPLVAASSKTRPIIHRLMYHYQRYSLKTPNEWLKRNILSRFGPILGGLEPCRTMPIRCAMRCALGHGSSPFLRIGAIHGVPDASREFSFDPCHQQLHRMTLHKSPVSSRDLARSGLFDELEGPADHLHQWQRPRKRAPAACMERLHPYGR